MKNNKLDILFDICVDNFEDKYKDIIEKVIKESLLYENINGNFEVSVTIISDEEMQEINLKHRGIDRTTDVLSFPLINDFKNLNNDFQHSLGDIIISFDKAIQQSEDYNHSIDREIAFLTAHSMLHLLGYDHMVEEEEKEMFFKQEEILTKLKFTRSNING